MGRTSCLTLEDRYKFKELYDRNFSQEEIAQAFDISLSTVRAEIERGRDKSLSMENYNPEIAQSRLRKPGPKKGTISQAVDAERRRWRVMNFSIRPSENFDDEVEQTYAMLREKIISGDVSYGIRLPSVRFLVEETGASKAAVYRAYQRLCKEGYVISLSSSGHYVTYKDGKVTKVKVVEASES